MSKPSFKARCDKAERDLLLELGFNTQQDAPLYQVPLGAADAKEGTEEWAYWQHLGMRTKVSMTQKHGSFVDTHGDYEFKSAIEGVSHRLHKAMNVGWWKLLKGPDGKPFGCFEDYCRCIQPWGIGWGTNWPLIKKLLRHYDSRPADVNESLVTRIDQDRLRDGRDENGGDRRSSEFQTATIASQIERDRRSDKQQERDRQLLRAPRFIQILHEQELLSKELACKFGPYVPEKPSEAQRAKADAVASAAADVERWVMNNLCPVGTDDKAVNSYKTELRGVCMEKLGQTSQGFFLRSKDPGKVANQLTKHLPKQTLIELINLLAQEVRS